MGKYNWEPFTEELAQKILSYSDNRQELLDKVRKIYTDYNDSLSLNKRKPNRKDPDPSGMYPLCGWIDDHKRTIRLNDERIHEIDPFTVFAYLYNGLQMGMPKSAEMFGEEFKLTNRFPSSEFDRIGIPTTTSSWKTLVYYSANDDYFSRSLNDSPKNYADAMELAWTFFKNALSYDPASDEKSQSFLDFAHQFEQIYNYPFTGIVTASMNLFYIAPKKFLSLDKNTINYIKGSADQYPESSKILDSYDLDKKSKNPIHGIDYLKLCRVMQREIDKTANPDIKTFSDLSYYAFANKNDYDEGLLENDNEENSVEISIENDKLGFLGNIIYYGIPGSGKSYKIKSEIIDRLDEQHDGDGSAYYKRILFHPDYSYSDFVGQILPKTVKDENDVEHVEYPFTPGPFTKILQAAIENKENNYYLIIDEINRGNAPAIFGDIFQLLDRVEQGKPRAGESQYRTTNDDIQNYTGLKSEIYLPKNLSIVATMNTSDQNVFTLDTAFKRRWRMEYIEDKIELCDFKDAKIGEMDNDTGVTWERFHDVINKAIGKSSYHVLSNEDKRLGAYFCSKEEVVDITLFTNKVLRYIWDDVRKINKDIFREGDTVNTFEDIYKAREKDDFFKDIFKNDIYEELTKS